MCLQFLQNWSKFYDNQLVKLEKEPDFITEPFEIKCFQKVQKPQKADQERNELNHYHSDNN